MIEGFEGGCFQQPSDASGVGELGRRVMTMWEGVGRVRGVSYCAFFLR